MVVFTSFKLLEVVLHPKFGFRANKDNHDFSVAVVGICHRNCIAFDVDPSSLHPHREPVGNVHRVLESKFPLIISGDSLAVRLCGSCAALILKANNDKLLTRRLNIDVLKLSKQDVGILISFV